MDAVQVFKALGEPTRLKIVEELSHGDSHTIKTLGEDMKMSRQGLRKHLQVLSDSKIITLKPIGRTMNVELDVNTLIAGKRFITKLEALWEKRLLALKDFVEKDSK